MSIQLRIHGSPALPTLIYLPGMHGDWTLVASFRAALAGKVRFVEMTYPRTATWSLNDYAREIELALLAAGVTEGWLIGESFGSQPAWQMIGRTQRGESGLRIHGLILAGGFVKHPWPWGAKLLRALTRLMPRWVARALLAIYSAYARFRHRHAPETLASIHEFVTNRLATAESAAMQRRYTLILENDLRPVARAARLPVFQLAGLVDPLVPNWLIRRWLAVNCPGYRASKTILRADHNVLGTAPQQSAKQIIDWISLKNAVGWPQRAQRARGKELRNRPELARQVSAPVCPAGCFSLGSLRSPWLNCSV
jgi:pimeloyl-ACP methyl ester carboxylesterase